MFRFTFELVRKARSSLGAKIEALTREGVQELLTESTRFLSSLVFKNIGACEGSLWWHYSGTDYLEVCYNSGPNPERLVKVVKQPLSEGIISLVFHTGEPAYTNKANQNPEHSKRIDEALEQQTSRMLACPLFLGGEVVGVISAVVLSAESNKCFDYQDLSAVRHMSELLEAYWQAIILKMSDADS